MKARVIAIVIMALTVLFVTVNTLMLGIYMRRLESMLAQIDFENGSDAFYEAYDYYKDRSVFITLTVSHSDLHEIEQDFAEISGALSVGDTKAAEVLKNRLVSSVEHMRRLTGVNIESIV